MGKKLRRVFMPLLLFCFVFTIFAPVAQAAVPAYGNTAQSKSTVIAKIGSYGSYIQEIKAMLKELGYLNYYGKPSGFYDTTTAYAVKYFQSRNGLTATGVVDQATYDLLKQQYADKGGDTKPADPAPAPQPEPKPEPKPEPQPKPQPKPDPQPTPQPKPDPTPAPQPKPEPKPEPVQGLSAEEQQMVNLINQERAKAGVAPLKVDLRMVQSARVKSKDMIDNNYFSHTSPTLGGFATLIRKYAPDYRYLGENLAGNRSVQAAHTALMNSEGHRRNILNPNYTSIGIGIVNGGPYGKMFTQHFGG
jgi:uncharacterized YkwD family protein